MQFLSVVLIRGSFLVVLFVIAGCLAHLRQHDFVTSEYGDNYRFANTLWHYTLVSGTNVPSSWLLQEPQRRAQRHAGGLDHFARHAAGCRTQFAGGRSAS